MLSTSRLRPLPSSDIDLTNVPFIRLQYRLEALAAEVQLVEEGLAQQRCRAAAAAAARVGSTTSHIVGAPVVQAPAARDADPISLLLHHGIHMPAGRAAVAASVRVPHFQRVSSASEEPPRDGLPRSRPEPDAGPGAAQPQHSHIFLRPFAPRSTALSLAPSGVAAAVSLRRSVSVVDPCHVPVYSSGGTPMGMSLADPGLASAYFESSATPALRRPQLSDSGRRASDLAPTPGPGGAASPTSAVGLALDI